jgi:hypothetical protein
VESLEDRRLLAVVWDGSEPLGSFSFQPDAAGEIGGAAPFEAALVDLHGDDLRG